MGDFPGHPFRGNQYQRGDRVSIGGKSGAVRGLIDTPHGPGYLVKLDEGGYVHIPKTLTRPDGNSAPGSVGEDSKPYTEETGAAYFRQLDQFSIPRLKNEIETSAHRIRWARSEANTASLGTEEPGHRRGGDAEGHRDEDPRQPCPPGHDRLSRRLQATEEELMEENVTAQEPAPPAPGWRVKHTNRGANGGTSPLPPGKGWLPHVGFKQRLRAHKQVWAQFEKLCKRDSYAAATRERLLDFVAELPQSEIAAISLALKTRVAASELGTSWMTALNRALNELEEQQEKAKIDPAKGVVVSAA